MNNTCSLLLMRKPVAHWLMVLKILNELAAENTHTDSHTNHFLENEVAAVALLLIPLFKSAARMMLPESLVK